MATIDKIASAMRSAKFALIQAKKIIARNLDTGGEDEWAQCDYAIREIDAVDMAGDLDTLRARVAELDGLLREAQQWVQEGPPHVKDLDDRITRALEAGNVKDGEG